VLAVSGLASGALSTRKTIALEAPPSTPSSKRLSIYPDPDPEIVLEEVHSDLERNIGIARAHVVMAYDTSRANVHGVVGKWINVEEKVEHRIKSLIPKDETMTPGILYVGVATMAGSIVGRTRALPIRMLLPPTFFLLSFRYFLPKTASNVRAYASSLEDTYIPSLGAQHAAFNRTVTNSTVKFRATLRSGVGKAESAIEGVLKKAEEWSGLKLHTGGKK